MPETTAALVALADGDCRRRRHLHRHRPRRTHLLNQPGGTVSRKRATLTVEVTFDGTYYDLSEIVSVAEDWIHAGLEDRDDVRGVTITGTAEPLPDAEADR